jgi:chromosome partitioning protein
MSTKSKIIAICNQKGGVGKTVTTVNLGIGLARQGKRVLLVDVDAQGSLTASLGYQHPDQLDETLATVPAPVFPQRIHAAADGRGHPLPAGKLEVPTERS